MNRIITSTYKQITYLLLVGYLLLGIQVVCTGKENKYRVSDIPKELTKGAYSVLRSSEIVYERTSVSTAKKTVVKAITILNKKALDEASFYQYYNNFSKVRKIRIVVYDEFGNVVKKKGNDDIMDISAIDGGTLFSDARVKIIDAEYQTIPFTVEVCYEVVSTGILSTPNWAFYPWYNSSVEKSSFTIITSGKSQLRFYKRNTELEPVRSIDDGKVILKWEVSNLPAIKKEKFSLSFRETSPVILTNPSYFWISGYGGNADTWESFGHWINQLNEGRDKLPDETVNEIKSMLSDSLSEIETIKMLYQWMQDKTRYVSIQVGIGGWQPMLASDVDKFSYGDCKALTNYMHSILNVAGIDSYYTLVKAGSYARSIISEFPGQQFNHAILCVPVEQDTIWLECTSQTNPFGYMGTFTDDRDVLVVSDDGGKLVHTKVYDKDDNSKITNAKVEFNEFGNGSAKIKINNKGYFYSKRLPVVMSPKKEQQDFIVSNIDIPSFELEKFSFIERKTIIPEIEEDIELEIKSYTSKLGTRLLFCVNLMNKHGYQFRRSAKRKNDIYLRRDFCEIDTIVFSIPENYRIEAIPENVELNSEFGFYSSMVISDSVSVSYIRNFELSKGLYEKTSYPDFKKFSTDVRNADNQKVVLIEIETK